jgi:hypothetical protein
MAVPHLPKKAVETDLSPSDMMILLVVFCHDHNISGHADASVEAVFRRDLSMSRSFILREQNAFEGYSVRF